MDELPEEVMKCVICHSSNIEAKIISEPVWTGTDVVLVPCRVLVCGNCGERYYSRQTMRSLEDVEAQLRARTLELEAVGRVMKISAQPAPALIARESGPDYTIETADSSEAKE